MKVENDLMLKFNEDLDLGVFILIHTYITYTYSKDLCDGDPLPSKTGGHITHTNSIQRASYGLMEWTTAERKGKMRQTTKLII